MLFECTYMYLPRLHEGQYHSPFRCSDIVSPSVASMPDYFSPLPVHRPAHASTTQVSKNKLQPASDVVAIAIMGATGSGKSTFINIASGSQLGVGAGLESCTSDVQTAKPFELDGRRVLLIDTPGFDDTSKSDTDILKLIASFLQTTYEKGMTLAGVIYMHRIMDVRVGGISKRNFNMFRELCGDETLKNVVIVTTFWSEVTPQVGAAREAELQGRDIFFKPVLEKQARMLRHSNTVESAHGILRQLIGNRPLGLCIQHELVDQGLNLSQTKAGAMLSRELLEQAEKHKQEIRAIQVEMEAAIKKKDEETRKELEEESRKLQKEMLRMQTESQQLANEYKAEKAEMENRVREMQEKAREEAEQQRQAHMARMRELDAQLQNSAKHSAEEKQRMQEQMNALKQQYDSLARSRSKSGGWCVVA